IENNIKGTVYVSFIVEPDGTTTNHIITKDIGYSCGQEVIRVIKLMPAWIPGKINGRSVRVRTTLPVKFNFN
ncbi:MAG TPA: energy transducer TonB, partial [Bacteroidia bacterium]|nr:energy transducer TonB [Bacteroidia bacterium]